MALKKKATESRKAVKKPAKKATSQAKAPRASAEQASKIVKLRKVNKPKSPTGSLTQSEFLENLQGFCGLPKKVMAKELALDISEMVTEVLKRGYKIPLFGLGKITVRKTKKRQGRNPATGEAITIPARKKVRFSPAKSLKEAVL
jgi:DNA-binding protein HU-beta